MGRKLTAPETEVIINLFSHLKEVKKLLIQLSPYVTSAVKLDLKKHYKIEEIVSKICNTSTRTVSRIVNTINAGSNNSLDPNNINGDGDKTKNWQKQIICSQENQDYIVRVLLDFYANRENPTSKDLWEKCLGNPEFPRVGFSLFKKWMKDKCQLKYQKINKKPVFLERPDIIIQREKYMRSIKKYREEGYYIIYTDETWADIKQSPGKLWQAPLNPNEVKQYQDIVQGNVLQNMKGETGGFILKGGQGRIIINHAGGRDGFLPNVEDIFRSKKNSSDYHECMNIPHWTNWFVDVLENAPDHSVIVVDQAPYHRERIEETVMAKLSWNKPKIISNLKARNIPLPSEFPSFEKMTKVQLIGLSEEHPVKLKYRIEELAENCGKDIKVLWFPVAHCEFNPIELVWSNVKGYIGKHNKGEGPNAVLELTKEAVHQVTPKIWSACCDHAIKFEQLMWKRDGIIEEHLFPDNPEGEQPPAENGEESDEEFSNSE